MTSRERAEAVEARLANDRCPIVGGPDMHLGTGKYDCGACTVDAIKRAIDEAVAEDRKRNLALDEAINEVVELAASYSKSIPGMREALQRVWDIEDGAK